MVHFRQTDLSSGSNYRGSWAWTELWFTFITWTVRLWGYWKCIWTKVLWIFSRLTSLNLTIRKAAQPFIDEQVAVYDCVERLKGFNYVGIIDFDEIVYTRITYKHNLKPLLKYLNHRYPDASGFSFMTEIFVTDWFSGANSSCNSSSPETDTSTKLWYPQFVNRTAPMVDRVKNIINTDRVVLDSVWTHSFTSLPGYRKYTISSSLGCLKHFRSCREKWIDDGKCFRLRKYKDYTVANLVRNIRNTIHQKRKMTLGP